MSFLTESKICETLYAEVAILQQKSVQNLQAAHCEGSTCVPGNAVSINPC